MGGSISPGGTPVPQANYVSSGSAPLSHVNITPAPTLPFDTQPGFFERLNTGILGLQKSPLFQLGMGLLDAGKPSTTPQSFGGNLAQAFDQLGPRLQAATAGELARTQLQGQQNALARDEQTDYTANRLWDQNFDDAGNPRPPPTRIGGQGPGTGSTPAIIQQDPAAGGVQQPPPPLAPPGGVAPSAPPRFSGSGLGTTGLQQGQALPASPGFPAQPPPAQVPPGVMAPYPMPAGGQPSSGYPAQYPGGIVSDPAPPVQPLPGFGGQGPGSPSYQDDLAWGESRGNWDWNVENKSTETRGGAQFQEETWKAITKRHGLDPNNHSPENQKAAEIALRTEHAEALKKNMLPVNDTNLKALHVLGQSQGLKFLHAKESKSVGSVLERGEIDGNPDLFKKGSKGRDLTVGEAKAAIDRFYKVPTGQGGPETTDENGEKYDSVVAGEAANMSPQETLQTYAGMPPELKKSLMLGAMYASGGDRRKFAEAFGKAIIEYNQKRAEAEIPGTSKRQEGGPFLVKQPNGSWKKEQLEYDPRRGYVRPVFDKDGSVRYEVVKEEKQPTTPSTGGYLNANQWATLNKDMTAEKIGLKKIRDYAGAVGGLKEGVSRWANSVLGNVKIFLGNSRGLTDEEYKQKYGMSKVQGLIGATRLEQLGPGVVTEYDAGRLLLAAGGLPDSAFQSPEVLASLLSEMYEDKIMRLGGMQKDYERNYSVFYPGEQAPSLDVPETLTSPEPGALPAAPAKRKFAPDKNGVWSLQP